MTLTESVPASLRPGRTATETWLGWATIALGLGAGAVALLGPLVGDVIEYHASEGAVNQIVGGDVAGLALVAPLALVAGWAVLAGKAFGRVLALGPALYGLYMYSQLALGGDVVHHPGNSERFFLLFTALFILAGGIAARAWATLDRTSLPRSARRTERRLGGYLVVVAAFLAVGLHLPGLVDAWSTRPASPEYLADPVVFWVVKFMDLGIVVPLLVVVGVALWRGRAWGRIAAYPAAAWAALLGSSVAGMAIVMQATGDPSASMANTVAFSAFAGVALAFAWVLYRPLLEAGGPAGGNG